MTYNKNNGFSLVELSIVLVIIGLLVGGVITGKTLIHASQLRSITSEHDKFLTAVGAFQGKYLALPGDMPNATQFWGVKNGNATDCKSYTSENSGGGLNLNILAASSDQRTCDGNGDKQVTFSISIADSGNSAMSGGCIPSAPGCSSTDTEIQVSMEAALFWQHLGNAALINGTYGGAYGGDFDVSGALFSLTIPANTITASPSGKIAQSVWGTKYNDIGGNSLYYMKGSQYNDFDLLTGAEVLNVDSKIDDGAPNTGKVHPAATSSPAPCITGASYNATSTIKNCGIEFSNQF